MPKTMGRYPKTMSIGSVSFVVGYGAITSGTCVGPGMSHTFGSKACKLVKLGDKCLKFAL